MSKSDQIQNYVKYKLKTLYDAEDNNKKNRGRLANLRRGVGKKPGEIPETWGLIFDNLPEELLGTDRVSNSEFAIYTALTLYAMHQQGNEQCMQKDGVSIGKAAAEFVKKSGKSGEESKDRIITRLNILATSSTVEDLAYHLRSFIQILSADSIGLDYSRLAKELYMMNFDSASNDIKFAWGREFYREFPEKDEKNDQKKEDKQNEQ